MDTSEYILARKSQLKYYRNVELYKKIENKGFVLYKRSGITIDDMRIDRGMHPPALYVKRCDKLKGLREAQKGFNKQLKNDLRSGNPARVRETLVTIVQETFMEPRSGSLEGIANTVDLFIGDYAEESDIIRNLVDMSSNDYSTVLHSINVMAFALGFAAHMSYSPSQTKSLGLCALLHDVGKCKVRKDILAAPRPLTDEEFKEMKCHTIIGNDILNGCLFGDKDIARTALEHHEKLDGSGYPFGKTNISKTARIIGVIDCYEALTNDSRPYRDGMNPFDCLERVIGKDTTAGKFDRVIYSEFVQSLKGKQRQKALSVRLEALDAFSANL